jgi:competence protein ComEC
VRTPALYALIFFGGGILLATNTALPAMVYLGVAVLASALAIIGYLLEKTTTSRAAICLAVLSAGAFLTELQSAEFPSNHISHFAAAGKFMTVTGMVVSEPDIRPAKTFLTVQVDSLQHRDRTIAACGKLRLQIQAPTAAFGYRDLIKFTGYVNQPFSGRNPGAFDYRRYLQIRQISATVTVPGVDRITRLESGASEPFVRTIVAPVRDYISSVFERSLPSEQAAVMKGFLIGDVRNISREVYQRFKNTGTLHVLAASGANVGYVVASLLLVIRLFRLPRQYRIYLLIAGVVIFSFLAYNQPSVVRAAVMAIVTLIGMALYRDTNWLNNISVAGLVILVFRPLYLFDLGFQLSFGAAFALILFMPVCEKWMPKPIGIIRKATRYFLMIFYGSIIAQLGVIPILIYNFHTVPLVSFVANLIVVPLVGVATTLGVILVFLSAIPVVSTLLAEVLTLTLKLTLASIDYFHALPIPQLRLGAPHLLAIIAYYLALQLVFAFASRKRIGPLFAVLLLISTSALIWKNVLADGGNETEITFLDTRDMTTVFIEQTGGRTVLINGGGANQSVNLGEVAVLPFLLAKGIDHLHSVFATTTQAGNVRSLLSAMAGVEQSTPSAVDDSAYLQSLTGRIELIDSSTIFSYPASHFLLLTGSTPVQNLSNLPPTINVVAADWHYLKQDGFVAFLKSFHVETVILTSYPTLYTSKEPLRRLREELPNLHVHSVLESGGITLDLAANGFRVLATANR